MWTEVWPCTHQVEDCLCQFSPERLAVVNEAANVITHPMSSKHRDRALELLQEGQAEDALWHIHQAARLDAQAVRDAFQPRLIIGPIQVEHQPQAEATLAAGLAGEALGLHKWKDGQWV